MYFQYRIYERVHLKDFFPFWETENNGFFSSKTASFLRKTCFSSSLKKVATSKQLFVSNDDIYLKMSISGAILLNDYFL